MKGNTKLSVIVPCFNAGRFLEPAVESVLGQRGDFTIREILIVDDRSDDPETIEALRRIAALGAVRVVSNDRPRGPAGARNCGIAKARSDWISFLDADDIMAPGSMEQRLAALRAYPHALWASADFLFWHEDGTTDARGFFESRPLTRKLLEQAYTTGRPTLYERPTALFLTATVGHFGASVFHRELLETAGPIDEELLWTEDHHYFLRLSPLADMVYSPTIAFRYRQHDTNTTKETRWPPGYWHIRMLEKLLADPAFRDHRRTVSRLMAYYHRCNSLYHRERRDNAAALQEAAHAVVRAPSCFNNWRATAAALLRR